MKPISRTFPKKAIAQRWMLNTEADIAAGEYKEDEQQFGELVKRYLIEIGKIKPMGRTKANVLESLRASLGHHKLKDLTTPTLTAYAVERAVAPSTAMQDMIYIGVVLTTAESMWGAQPKMDEYRKAMVTLKKLGVIAEAQHRDRRVSDNEIRKILSYCSTGFPMADLVWFAVHTAMRCGEQMRIRWDDLGDEGRSILIRQRKHPKQKRDQRVPLLPEAAEILHRQPRIAEQVFPYEGRSVTAAFRRARKRAGLEDLRWHDLRHEGCSRLFERGLDTMTVSLFSGHRDINMLKRYTHLNASQILDSL